MNMIDTVTVWFPISPSQSQLNCWVSHPRIFPNGRRRSKFYQYARVAEFATATCVYYPPNLPVYPRPWLSIEVSLPKVLFRENINPVSTEFHRVEAIAQINQFISDTAWLPNLDFGSGILWRLDCVYNHYVGKHVQDFVRVLYNLDYPARKTMPYSHEGVQFKSGVAVTKFYDKFIESSSPDAVGILRQETTLRHTYYIERRLDIPNPTLRNISFLKLSQILNEDLLRLHLNSCIMTTRSTANFVLVRKYGYVHGNKLFGHLIASQSMSRDQIIASGANPRTIRYYNQQIVDAGISLALLDDGMYLPQLEILMTDGNSLPRVVSDT